MKECLRFGSPGFKLGAFGVVLGLALGGGLLVGATVGPEPSSGDETADHDADYDADQPVAVSGLQLVREQAKQYRFVQTVRTRSSAFAGD